MKIGDFRKSRPVKLPKHLDVNLIKLAHPALKRKLETIFRKYHSADQSFGVGIDQPTLHKINRAIATQPEVLLKLSALPENLEALTDFLWDLGFKATQKKQDPPPPSFLVNIKERSLESPSPLEKFRRNPVDVDQAHTLAKEGHLEEVRSIFSYEVTSSQPNPDILNAAFNFFYEIKDWNNFIKAAERMLDLHKKAGLLATAETDEEGAIFLRKAYRRLAEAYYTKGNFRAAKRVIFEALQVLPAFSDSFLGLYCEVEIQLGHFKGCFVFLKDRISLEDPLPRLMVLTRIASYLAVSDYLPEKELEEIIIIYEKFKEKLSSDSDEEVKVQLQDPSLKPEFEAINLRMAAAYLRKGDFKKAQEIIESYAQALGEREKNFLDHLFRAQSFLEEEKAEAAQDEIRAAEKAASLPWERQVAARLLSEIQRKLPPPPPPSPTVTAPSPSRSSAEIDSETFAKKVIFRGEWAFYKTAFPENQKEILQALQETVGTYQGLLVETSYPSLENEFKEEKTLALSVKLDEVLQKLGIAKIGLVWEESLTVRFYIQEEILGKDKYFVAKVNNQYQVEIAPDQSLRLAGSFLEATILEKIFQTLYPELAEDLVEKALEAKPLPPAVWKREEPPPKPKAISPLPAETKVAPPLTVEVKLLPSPEEEFFKKNSISFNEFRALVAELGVNVMEYNIDAIKQSLDLIEIIEKRRDQGEDPDCFRVIPLSSDPLAKAIKLVRIYGPLRGKEKLRNLGFSSETLAKLGFENQLPSNLLSVVEIDFEIRGEGKTFIGVVNPDGELVILGEETKGEILDQIQRTVLESLARVVVPETKEIYRIIGLPSPLRKEEISKREIEEGQVPRRVKILPALVILERETSPQGMSQALESVVEEIRKVEIQEKGILSQRLFYREGNIYHPFPEEPSEKESLYRKLSPSQIYLQVSRGYAYRLPLGRKKTKSGAWALFPFEIDPAKLAAAQSSRLKLDLALRLYFYGVIEYENYQYLSHPKVSTSTEGLSPASNEDPQYWEFTVEGFKVKVYQAVSESLALEFLKTPEVQAAISSWKKGETPEFQYANPIRRQQLKRLTPLERYFLIMPTNRGYYQGRFVSLAEYFADQTKD